MQYIIDLMKTKDRCFVKAVGSILRIEHPVKSETLSKLMFQSKRPK